MRGWRATAVAAGAVLGLSGLGSPAVAAVPGTPHTWGSNSFGELGDGTGTHRFTAGAVAGFGDAVEIHGGREHVVALRSDGTVWTWGSNQYGQLGNGSTVNRPTPAAVSGLSGVPTWPPATTTRSPCWATAPCAPGA